MLLTSRDNSTSFTLPLHEIMKAKTETKKIYPNVPQWY